MKFEVFGIIISVIVAIGIAVYQVRATKLKAIDKRKSKSHQDIWNALNQMRIYYETGMQTELHTIGSLKLLPILEFRNVVNDSKANIESNLYEDLVRFYEIIAKETNVSLFEPMKLYLTKKDDLFPNELHKIEIEVNSNRIKIKNEIEKYMQLKKEIFE